MPGAYLARLDRLEDDLQRLLVVLEIRRESALVADARRELPLDEHLLERVEHLGAHAQRFGERLAPTGTIMNSWKSTVFVACAPPLRMFIIGTGSVRDSGPPR